MRISIVVPVYNEEKSIPALTKRLIASMDDIGDDYEIIFTNDGSKDNSLDLLRAFQQEHPDKVKVVDFLGNHGQHMAIIAAFEQAEGDVCVTLDADMQTPPEEISKVIKKFKEGHDYVGSYRIKRNDNFVRTYCSKLINWLRAKLTNINMSDQGCMLRAYSPGIVKQIVKGGEKTTFVTALAYKYSLNPAEVGINHIEREFGTSNYSVHELIRVTFDLITGFSIVPLQIFTTFGLAVSGLSGMLVLYMLVRRFIIGPEAEGIFTLFAILFFLISVLIAGVGLVGEYIGRIYINTSSRPRYVVREVIKGKKSAKS